MEIENKKLIDTLKQELFQALDDLEETLNKNQITLKEIYPNILEITIKVENEDKGNPYLQSLDSESDKNGTEYFININ